MRTEPLGTPYRIVAEEGAIVRRESELNSPEVCLLPFDTVVYVAEVRGRRARVVQPMPGWVSLQRQHAKGTGSAIALKCLGPAPTDESLQKLEDKIWEAKEQDHVQIIEKVLGPFSEVPFDYETMDLEPETFETIRLVARVLELCDVRIICDGHVKAEKVQKGANPEETESFHTRAKEAASMLSEQAAEAVRKALIDEGVDYRRVDVRASGDEQNLESGRVRLIVLPVLAPKKAERKSHERRQQKSQKLTISAQKFTANERLTEGAASSTSKPCYSSFAAATQHSSSMQGPTNYPADIRSPISTSHRKAQAIDSKADTARATSPQSLRPIAKTVPVPRDNKARGTESNIKSHDVTQGSLTDEQGPTAGMRDLHFQNAMQIMSRRLVAEDQRDNVSEADMSEQRLQNIMAIMSQRGSPELQLLSASRYDSILNASKESVVSDSPGAVGGPGGVLSGIKAWCESILTIPQILHADISEPAPATCCCNGSTSATESPHDASKETEHPVKGAPAMLACCSGGGAGTVESSHDVSEDIFSFVEAVPVISRSDFMKDEEPVHVGDGPHQSQ